MLCQRTRLFHSPPFSLWSHERQRMHQGNVTHIHKAEAKSGLGFMEEMGLGFRV